MTMIEVEPQPLIDTLVRLPDGQEARRTEYAGAVWFDGKPYTSGLTLHRSPKAPRGLRHMTFEASFFLPDSLAYDRSRLADSKLSLTAVLAATGDTGAVLNATATFTDDPAGTPTWILVHVHGHIGWPAGVGYRVVALTPPDAIR
jgi:hypothetical protein